ncbi:uncharacterized protein Fot_52056 [Forsythia ovata]|uniref:Uncharacterized protein n=1 Tax=Forsythia ovata TaxID=205694 RepID=A0ABD1PJD1_9LAMI
MECNKEEAIRAKDIAQRKMENQDFMGARKIAKKAQQLYPDLENISQMIVVCDVHCSAENMFYGNEKDWYSKLSKQPMWRQSESSIENWLSYFILIKTDLPVPWVLLS